MDVVVLSKPGLRKIGDVIEIEQLRVPGVVMVGKVIDLMPSGRDPLTAGMDALTVRVLAGEA